MGVRKQKVLCQLSDKVFNWLEWNLVFCWDLFSVGVVNLSLEISVDLDEMEYVATPCLFKLVLNLFSTNNIPGRKLCCHDFFKKSIWVTLLWIYTMGHAHSAGQPSGVTKIEALYITLKGFNLFFFSFFFFLLHTRHAYYRLHWLLPFYSTFTDLDIAWGSQVNTKHNLLASFSHTLLKFIRTKFVKVLK